ncbi:putative plant SNARE 11 [Drosera capensis]
MSSLSGISEELAELDGQIADIFRALSNGFQKLEKIKDPNRRSRQLEELTDKMKDCKRAMTVYCIEPRDINIPDLKSGIYELVKTTNGVRLPRERSLIPFFQNLLGLPLCYLEGVVMAIHMLCKMLQRHHDELPSANRWEKTMIIVGLFSGL